MAPGDGRVDLGKGQVAPQAPSFDYRGQVAPQAPPPASSIGGGTNTGAGQVPPQAPPATIPGGGTGNS